jgi:hypothetical protein
MIGTSTRTRGDEEQGLQSFCLGETKSAVEYFKTIGVMTFLRNGCPRTVLFSCLRCLEDLSTARRRRFLR